MIFVMPVVDISLQRNQVDTFTSEAERNKAHKVNCASVAAWSAMHNTVEV